MTTKRKAVGVAAFRRQARQLMAATEGLDIADLDRRAKVMTGVSRAKQAALELAEREAVLHGADERLDAAGEERLRADLIRRLDALEAEMQAGARSEGDGGAGPPAGRE